MKEQAGTIIMNEHSHKYYYLAWITYILNLLVALPVIGVLFYFGVEVNAWFSAIICIVLFGLWGYYQYYNVVQKNPRPKGITAFKVVLIIVIIAAGASSRYVSQQRFYGAPHTGMKI